MSETRWTLPERAVMEDMQNRNLAGTGMRFCFHVDRTLIMQDSGMLKAECDYCNGWGIARPGALPDIHPSLLKETP